MEEFSRTEKLIGQEKLNKLRCSNIAVFGVGGVGGYAVEALARCGVNKFTLVDNDTISISNINRQIIALHSTVGKYKVDVMKERILDINPDALVTVKKIFYLPINADSFDLSEFDYIIDAIDTVTAKITLIENAKKQNIRIISSMGAGNKLDPSKFQVADISKTSVCPLARVMRRELKVRGIESVKVVFSTEEKVAVSQGEEHLSNSENEEICKRIPSSISYAPSVAGLMIAAEVIKDLML